MKNNQDTATANAHLDELKTLVNEAETMVTGSLSAYSDEALRNLRARFDAVLDRVAPIYEGAKNKVVAGAKCTDATIRENPYQSLAIAVGVGLLAGVLLGRNSNK